MFPAATRRWLPSIRVGGDLGRLSHAWWGIRCAAARVTALVVVTSTAAALIGVAGQARAVDPDTLRPGCEWRTPDEEAQHIQTCTLYSEALGRNVVVQVRASDQAPGQTEQAVYFLDGLGSNDEYNNWATPTSGAVAAYSTSYNLVMPAGGKGEWDTNWQSAPTGSTTAPQWDTFLGEELPAYLNENFDIGTSDNAIVGVSMSGAPAVIVALNHPEVFAVARSYSVSTRPTTRWVGTHPDHPDRARRHRQRSVSDVGTPAERGQHLGRQRRPEPDRRGEGQRADHHHLHRQRHPVGR